MKGGLRALAWQISRGVPGTCTHRQFCNLGTIKGHILQCAGTFYRILKIIQNLKYHSLHLPNPKRDLWWETLFIWWTISMLLGRTFDNLAVIISISIKSFSFKMIRRISSVFCSLTLTLSHFLVLINNLSKQILSLHILHFITAHFTFITAQIGYHCTLKLAMAGVEQYVLNTSPLCMS
jgi:hypothetical protein